MAAKKKIKIVKKVIEFAVYAGVAYFVYKKLGGSISKIDIRDYNYGLLGLSILVFSIHNLVNATTWDYLVRSFGNKTKYVEQMDVYLRSYILRYIPGNVVGIMARGIFNREHDIPMGQSLWGWFLENIVYLGLAILIGSYAILSGAISSSIVLAVMAITITVAILMMIKADLLELIFNKVVVQKLAKKYKNDLTDLKLDISSKAKIMLVLRYLFAWAIYSLSFLIVLSAVGVEPLSDPLLFISINALAYAIGYLSIITPSGAGVREGVMVASLTDIAGLEPEIALVVALGARVVFIIGELSGFLLFYLYKILNRRK